MTSLSPGADMDTLIAELAENSEEQRLMAAAARLLAYAAPPEAASVGLRDRLMARVREGERPAQFWDGISFFARSAELEWTEIEPGIDLKMLFRDPDTGARTMMVRMAPNLDFPLHPHHVVEDLFLVSGEAWVGDVPMAAGDYCRAPAGTEHANVRSGASGSLAVVISR